MLEVVAILSVLATVELIMDGFELSGGVMDEVEVIPKPLVVIDD